MGSALRHGLQTIAAYKVYRFAGTGNVVAAGTNIAVVMAGVCGGCVGPAFCGSIVSCNTEAPRLVSVKLYLLNIVVQYPFE